MKKISLTNLIRTAQNEQPPEVDVAAGVISVLSELSQQTMDPSRAYFWMGAVSAAAACVLLAMSLLMRSGGDSVSEMMTYVSWVNL